MNMADKLLSKNRSYRKLKGKLAKVEEFVDKAANIKKKVDKVLGFLGGRRGATPQQGPGRRLSGREAQSRFTSDDIQSDANNLGNNL
jgi:hypothetical protein